MVLSKKNLGYLGEKIACQYLQNKKYKILARNYQKRFGEIDIIALSKEKTLVFFEVKARTSSRFGRGEESVNPFKQRKLVKTVYYYLWENKIKSENFQIDVISIEMDFKHRKSKVTHYKNAVGD